MHEFHKFASMFPLMEGKELDDLVADIKANGQHEPIVMLEDTVLDGRNRYIACLKLKIKPRLRDFNCGDGGDPLSFVWSANVTRRHLTEGQRGVAMAKRTTFLEHGNVKAQRILSGPGTNQKPLSLDEAAKIANVSPETIKRAKLIIQGGTPEEIENIEKGKAGIRPTYDKVSKRTKVEREAKKAEDTFGSLNSGGRIYIPDGKTPEEITLEGLELEEDGTEISHVHKLLGISIEGYRIAREIVLIANRDDLNQDETKRAKQALQILNEQRRTACYSLVEPIALRIWGEGRSKSKDVESDRTIKFETKIGVLAQTGQLAQDIEIAQVDYEKIPDIIESLEDSIRGIKAFITRIKETYSV